MENNNKEEQKNNYKEIILWQNGKNKSFSFKYKIPLVSNIKSSLSQFKKEIIIFLKNNKNNISAVNEIIHFNHLKELEISKIKIIHLYTIKEMDLEEADIPYLKDDDVLFFSFDNSSFQDSNHFYQYEFVRWIKSGGYGKVFLAKKIITEKEYAIKQIDTSDFSTEEVYNISRENLILRTMNHKNVIKLYDSFTYDNKFFSVMDYAKGGELTLLLEDKDEKKEKRLTENESKKIFKQIYEAVCYIHERNIIHRDLKPNNILFLDEEKKHVVIIDFGISGFSNGNNREKIKAGTTMFLAPETACGKEYCSNRKLDIWALGIILYRMVEGVYPFDGKNSKEIINNIMKKKLEFNKKIKISIHLKNLIEGMLEKNHRFRIDDDSELFSKWFDFTPKRKNSTIIVNNISKDPIFDNLNKDNNENEKTNLPINKNNDNSNLNEENKKEINKSSLSNIFRGKSFKNNNKFKLYLNLNNEKKVVKDTQSEIEKMPKNKVYKKNSENLIFRNLKPNINDISSLNNNKEIEENNNKKKNLILPALSIKNIKRQSQISSPFNIKANFKNKKNIIKSNLPNFDNNLLNKNEVGDNNSLYNNNDKYTSINSNNEILNDYNSLYSNHSSKKRSMSEFKNKILQTINNNNLFQNKNNILNQMNNFRLPINKNIITQNYNADNESPLKKNKIKSLSKRNRNISSCEMNFPLIND